MEINIKELLRKEILSIEPYIPPMPVSEIKKQLNLTDLTILVSNENALSPSEDILDAIRKELGNLNRYPDGGAHYLKKDLARKLKVTPDNIVLGNGGDEVLSMICETFLNSGEEVLLGRPSFVAYEIFCRIAGGKPINVDLTDYKFDLDKIQRKIQSRTKLIFICNPNNPTGTIITQKELEDFMNRVPKKVIVVFDEAYMEYVESRDFPDTISLLKKYKNIIILRTFSKIYSMAGMRIGYAIASKDIIRYLNIVRKPYNVNVLAQIAARAALANHEIVSKSRKMNREGKKFLYDYFDQKGLFYVKTEANFIFVDTGWDSKEICSDFLKNGIMVRAGSAFGFPNFIRVTVGTQEENEKFIRVLDKLL